MVVFGWMILACSAIPKPKSSQLSMHCHSRKFWLCTNICALCLASNLLRFQSYFRMHLYLHHFHPRPHRRLQMPQLAMQVGWTKRSLNLLLKLNAMMPLKVYLILHPRIFLRSLLMISLRQHTRCRFQLHHQTSRSIIPRQLHSCLLGSPRSRSHRPFHIVFDSCDAWSNYC